MKSPSDRIKNWLTEKSLEWHQRLYGHIQNYQKNLSYRDSHKKEQIKTLPIIRLSNGSYSKGENCFFPDQDSDYNEMMPRVAKGVYSSGENDDQKKLAKEFLEFTKVRPAGEAEQIEIILKNRYSSGENWPEPETYFKDMGRFISLVKKCPDQSSLFSEYFIK